MKLLLTCYIFLVSFGSTLQSEWSSWKKTPCYDKVEYRYKLLRMHGTRHVFEIQFKNQYDKMIYFDYALADSEKNDDVHHARRTSLAARQLSKPISLFTNSEEFLINVGRLSFSPSDTDYEECDEER